MFKEVYQTDPAAKLGARPEKITTKPWEEMTIHELVDAYYQGDWDRRSKLETLAAYNQVQAALINNIAQEMKSKMGLDEAEAMNIIAIKYAELFSNKFRQAYDGYTGSK